MVALIDTNIIIRLLVPEDEVLTKKAEAFVRQHRCYITSIVFAETIFVLRSFYRYPKQKILLLKYFLDVQQFEVEDKKLNFQALERYCTTSLGFVDAWLLEKSKLSKLKLLTLDRKLAKAAKS